MLAQWALTRNLRPLALADIPRLPIDRLTENVVAECSREGSERARPVTLFGVRRWEGVELYVVLARDATSQLLVASALVAAESEYRSLTPAVPACAMFEREIFEEFGILPHGHPWLKPVRYPRGAVRPVPDMYDYPFFRVEGEGIHEVGVGPVHAGVIEPGHFRFMCHGEDVLHLEIALGYQHRGVERLLVERQEHAVTLAESIAGDSVIAHATAAANAVEVLGNCVPSLRALSIRGLALEMERAAIHIGDLGALAGDVAFLPGASVYGATRTLVINSLLAFTGSRFGRGLVRAGGVACDLDAEKSARITKSLAKVRRDTVRLSEAMFAAPSVLSRFERTGIVTHDEAVALGLTGPAARSSGVVRDVRYDHPFGIYRLFPMHPLVHDSGDVFARAWLRYVEALASLDYVLERLASLPSGGDLLRPLSPLAGESCVVSLVEGWRGEIVHALVTDDAGRVVRHRVQDPSLNNWFGLAVAVRGNGISDFPICNKSFNLSYAGHDL